MYPIVVRGGCFDDDPEKLRSAARRASDPDWSMQDPQIPQSVCYHTDAWFVGFRVVRPLRMPNATVAAAYEITPEDALRFRKWCDGFPLPLKEPEE